jgi:hypothetical protein
LTKIDKRVKNGTTSALQVLEMRKRIDQGLESLRRGEAVDGDDFFRALGREERARERAAKRG